MAASKTAPTCFGLQGNHLQGATVSTQLKITHLVKSRYVEAVQDIVSVMAASKTAQTCFGLQGKHHQRATVSTWLKITHFVKSKQGEAVQDAVSVMAAYCDITITMKFMDAVVQT